MVLPEFLERASLLPKDSKSKLVKVLHLLSEDFRHPSLQCKKIEGNANSVYECRVDQAVRLIYDAVDGMLRCWYVGAHDQALRFGSELEANQPAISLGTVQEPRPKYKTIHVDDVSLGESLWGWEVLQAYIADGSKCQGFSAMDIDDLLPE